MWKSKMSIVEQLAHAELLLRGANKEAGVNIREISADPLSVYMTKKRKMTQVNWGNGTV